MFDTPKGACQLLVSSDPLAPAFPPRHNARTSVDPNAFARDLVRWFRRRGRDLPWRRHRDPYRVWISEIMLQQTRIETAIPYYQRFLRRFPNMRSFARAPLDRVLKIWEGLGYYARARNLHRAVSTLVHEHGGRFPETADDWESLPGVGAYSAAAIASIVNGEPVVAIDGNVRRVAARLRNAARVSDAEVEVLFSASMGPHEPGLFNQAVMELGQRVCFPRRPACAACPVRRHCAAFSAGTTERVPARKAGRPVPHYEIAVGVCRKAGRILVSRRREDAMLGGLWEFPGGKIRPGESPERALAREFAEEVGLRIAVGPKIVTVPHRYSHFSVNLHAYECRHAAGRPRALDCAEVRWVRPAELKKLAFPAANRRILQTLKGDRGWPKT
ncbi:MAG: A/G-specific adenine glycosylase [Planctomycetes bacterium]|nr:A/G-specific adenine glycosylase [Planctomycetota bacterium]